VAAGAAEAIAGMRDEAATLASPIEVVLAGKVWPAHDGTGVGRPLFQRRTPAGGQRAGKSSRLADVQGAGRPVPEEEICVR